MDRSIRAPATWPTRYLATTRSGKSRTCNPTRGRATTSPSRRALLRVRRLLAGGSMTRRSPIPPTLSSRGTATSSVRIRASSTSASIRGFRPTAHNLAAPTTCRTSATRTTWSRSRPIGRNSIGSSTTRAFARASTCYSRCRISRICPVRCRPPFSSTPTGTPFPTSAGRRSLLRSQGASTWRAPSRFRTRLRAARDCRMSTPSSARRWRR